MTEEEKKAIRYLEAMNKSLDFNKQGFVYGSESIETALNLIQKQQAEIEKKDKIMDLIISRISCNLTIFDKKLQQYIKSEMQKGEYTNLDKLVKQYFEKQVEKE